MAFLQNIKMKSNGSNGTLSTPSTAPTNSKMEDSVAGSKQSDESSHSIEVGKEAKEKKDRSSWVKTLGMRTLRMRKGTDSRASRLSLPVFSSLERPGKNKKSKTEKTEETSENDLKLENITGSKLNSSSEHVKVQNNEISAASSVNGSTPAQKIPSQTQNKDRPTSAGENSDKQDPARFLGEGLTFKGKLIGVLEVNGPRGDRICQEALSELKMAVKAAGEHKQKVTVHVALDGLRIRDEKTGDCLYHHQVHKISFIAQDLTDTRAFGYIFGSPDTGHRFFGIKTEKSASLGVIAMRDLFQVVFDLKKKEIERAKQQLEMQQKFLATRAAETAPPSKPEPKFSIAETYIEGACAFRASSSYVPNNRSAPEVDLLNLEVELTSLQEGLDSIHHNLTDSGPFRGSTASISSDPMNPMPKRSSISSSTNTNNTTPIPSGFNNNSSSDPFGDSFDPYTESSGNNPSFNLGSSSKLTGCNQTTVSSNNSALTSPFPSDPFAQVDPFPGPKYPGDSEFFNSDPFDSPSGPFSFTFPSDSSSSANIQMDRKSSDGRLNSNASNGSPAPTGLPTHSNDVPLGSNFNNKKIKDEWTASFEDNFVPDTESTLEFSTDAKPSLSIFTELDPLGSGRIKPFIDRKDFFHEVKNPPKKVLNDHNSSDTLPSSVFSNNAGPSVPSSNVMPPSLSLNRNEESCKIQMPDGGAIPNSFSTNFNPPNNNVVPDFDSHFKTLPPASYDTRSESPPNYSPPPPPRLNNTTVPYSSTEFQPSNTRGVPFIAPPSSSSPSSRLLKKKSQILKQLTISESNSSPTTLPKSSCRLGKQLSVDGGGSSSLKDEIPNLSPPPPPRPPHNSGHASVTNVKTSSLTSAVPRPTSGSSSDKSRKISNVAGLPPEPPPRPFQTTNISSTSTHQTMQLVSPPPPLPPKKQSLNSTLSHPLNFKPSLAIDSKSFSSHPVRNSLSESNDLPLPLPLRKTHIVSEQSSFSALSGTSGRYAVPALNPSSLSESPSLVKRNNDSVQSTASIDSVTSKPNNNAIKLSMEQALLQVASLSLRDLASKLELPVDRLSSLTIQQLAEKLTEMDFGKRTNIRKESVSSRHSSERYEMKFGFDDDFSASSTSAPQNGNHKVQKDDGYDRYAVFRELAVEDASGFSIVNNFDSAEINNSDDDDQSRTLDKTLTSRDSSSERTLQADDITEGSNIKNASFATAVANTMDDVTDVNLSDDQDNSRFPLDDDDDLSCSGFINKPEWATFESNFDDQFATTALVKAEDGNESPWDSDEGEKALKAATLDSSNGQLNFKLFEKPAECILVNEEYKTPNEKEKRLKEESSPDPIKSPPGQFKRQSSGSSRHSERSSGNGTTLGRNSDFSDSGRLANHSKPRKGSKDYDRWEREGSGRFKERERDRDYVRSDSRNSYSSISRRYRNGDSEEDYIPSPSSNSTTRRNKGRVAYSKRDKDYDREVEPEDEEDDRSFASHHSNYSSGQVRKPKRYPPKHYHHYHTGRIARRGDKTTSPERYSNQESEDESFEDDTGGYPRKRDREYYAREREYYERHYRPRPGSGSGSIKRHSRDSPRHSDSYYRRDRRGRYRDEDEFEERECSEYSGEDGHRGHTYHGPPRRIRSKRCHHKERESRETRGHYYTNSPSWDSESCPEGEKESGNVIRSEKSSRRPTSGKDRNEEERHYSRGSPELSKRYEGSRRVSSGTGSARRYQSELSLNSKTTDSQKMSAFVFDDDFGASSLPLETSNQGELSNVSSPTKANDRSRNHRSSEKKDQENVFIPSRANTSSTSEFPIETKDSQSNSPFENDFTAQNEVVNFELKNSNKENVVWDDSKEKIQFAEPITILHPSDKVECVTNNYINLNNTTVECKAAAAGELSNTIIEDDSVNANGGELNPDIFPPANESKAFNFTGRRLESIKSEEEKSNDDSHSHSASESAVQMKKSDSFNLFKQRTDDPFADDDFFA